MTKEESANALAAELHNLIEWERTEKAKITLQLKNEGRYKLGLDANSEAYTEIIAESQRRYREIVNKYNDLPPDTKLKLW